MFYMLFEKIPDKTIMIYYFFNSYLISYNLQVFTYLTLCILITVTVFIYRENLMTKSVYFFNAFSPSVDSLTEEK